MSATRSHIPTFVPGDWPPEGWPRCVKCGKPVETVSIEHMTLATNEPYPQLVPTGEIILTVSCHGETARISNWRGVLQTHQKVDIYA